MRIIATVAAAMLAAASLPAAAQEYPSKPIRVIVPFPPGGALDGVMRTLSQPVSEALGQPLVFDNRPGAAQTIGMTACAHAAPDGYTLCTPTSDSLTYNPALYRKLPYDADADFIAITNLLYLNNLIVASASAPASFKDMIAFAKANPGRLNWATWGRGSIPEIYQLWVNRQWSAQITGVPYKGAGPVVPALLSGEVDVTFMPVGLAMPAIRAGKIRPLAAVGARRSPALPDVPSLAEEGRDPGLIEWFGIVAPAKTPVAIVNRIQAEYAKALKLPVVREFLAAQVLEPAGTTPAEFAAFLRSSRQNAARLLNQLGIQPTASPGG